ncbi:MAG TPA: hypothetical protein VEA41_14690 [Salinarimonas sp.]|nr:hypothetical protein [Salinarimonas sp.]
MSDVFLVSLISPAGAVTAARPSAREALALARRLEADGEVAITTPAGNTLALSDFVAIFQLG